MLNGKKLFPLHVSVERETARRWTERQLCRRYLLGGLKVEKNRHVEKRFFRRKKPFLERAFQN